MIHIEFHCWTHATKQHKAILFCARWFIDGHDQNKLLLMVLESGQLANPHKAKLACKAH